eukprot:15459882-Alexandrium_andersonii.AAC.1
MLRDSGGDTHAEEVDVAHSSRPSSPLGSMELVGIAQASPGIALASLLSAHGWEERVMWGYWVGLGGSTDASATRA